LEGAEEQFEEGAITSAGEAQLAGCLTGHAEALALSEMDVFEDFVRIRCAECRRHYALRVSAFETHQK
jgi:hypothetical protein